MIFHNNKFICVKYIKKKSFNFNYNKINIKKYTKNIFIIYCLE